MSVLEARQRRDSSQFPETEPARAPTTTTVFFIVLYGNRIYHYNHFPAEKEPSWRPMAQVVLVGRSEVSIDRHEQSRARGGVVP